VPVNPPETRQFARNEWNDLLTAVRFASDVEVVLELVREDLEELCERAVQVLADLHLVRHEPVCALRNCTGQQPGIVLESSVRARLTGKADADRIVDVQHAELLSPCPLARHKLAIS
jgi:hypothetical protein